ncbi:hypothetical protein OH77DRAFT_1516322 [Trametes cingulata]|nr:hypothetical protein OH77DRAFT_1516322 [Trametes cingulata]
MDASGEGSGLTSFEKRVQQKKISLFRSPRERAIPHGHPGAPASHDTGEMPQDPQHQDEATPRPGTGFPPSPPHTAELDFVEADVMSRKRPSRQLPLPPAQSSRLSASAPGLQPSGGSDIPESVSALEALRASNLYGRPEYLGAAHGTSSNPYKPGSTLSTTKKPATSSAIPPHLVPSTSSSSSGYSAHHYEPSDPGASSDSGADPYPRPIEGLRQTRSSKFSAVKGRIAALEERLQVSHDAGVAYA